MLLKTLLALSLTSPAAFTAIEGGDIAVGGATLVIVERFYEGMWGPSQKILAVESCKVVVDIEK